MEETIGSPIPSAHGIAVGWRRNACADREHNPGKTPRLYRTHKSSAFTQDVHNVLDRKKAKHLDLTGVSYVAVMHSIVIFLRVSSKMHGLQPLTNGMAALLSTQSWFSRHLFVSSTEAAGLVMVETQKGSRPCNRVSHTVNKLRTLETYPEILRKGIKIHRNVGYEERICVAGGAHELVVRICGLRSEIVEVER